MKEAAIIGWTGNGSLDDLARTALAKLPEKRAELTRATRSLMVQGMDPILVARRLARMPGTAWIAVGYGFDDLAQCLSRLGSLATRYLETGGSFKVSAEVEQSGKQEGDILMEATSTVLKAVKGTHVDEKNPEVWFRVIMFRGKGACGVQLREGQGGVPTTRRLKAACLVSGGYHGAVTAWMAALAGFSLTLVHAREDDESLRQVARLYAELSQRMDPSSLRLLVLEGNGPPGDRIAAWLDGAEGEVFTGVHPECRGTRSMGLLRRYRAAQFPLLLLQEREVRSRLDELGLRTKVSDREAALRMSGRKGRFSERTFAGGEVDQNAVLDSILG